MLNSGILTNIIQALSRFQTALINHDHPNLALEAHLHPEYISVADLAAAINARDAVNNINSVSGVLTIDLSLGNYFNVDLFENITSIVLINPPPSGIGFSKFIWFNQDATTAYTVTWPAIFIAAAGGPLDPVSTALGAIDVLAITSKDAGVSCIATFTKGFG